MSEPWLAGQAALVTGGATGIGAACAVELARRGASVAINFLDQANEAEAVAAQCADCGVTAVALQGDVASPADVEALFQRFDASFDRLDILVANAGIQRDADSEVMTTEDWQTVIDVNLTGQFLCAQQAIRRFLAQAVAATPARSRGKIVHMSSVHDVIPWAGHVNYAASKGGIALLAKSLALEFAGRGIRVNAVAPGAIRTPINADVWSDPDRASALEELIPSGRIGDPADVANAVAWLVSDYAGYVTGTTLYVDGGMTLYPGFRDNG